MANPSPTSNISDTDKIVLLALAKEAITHGLATGKTLPVAHSQYSPSLQTVLSSFVTLHIDGKLRGCIGSLEAHNPLVIDVAEHAHAAAFKDPRFPPLSPDEFAKTEVEISVLTPQVEISCANEQELLGQLQEHKDGLTLEDGLHRSTFLPSVWKQLPDKTEFVKQLKRKAGLPDNHWSPTLKMYRYRTISFIDKD